MKDLVSVRQVREILRLSFLGLSQNEISAASGVRANARCKSI